MSTGSTPIRGSVIGGGWGLTLRFKGCDIHVRGRGEEGHGSCSGFAFEAKETHAHENRIPKGGLYQARLPFWGRALQTGEGGMRASLQSHIEGEIRRRDESASPFVGRAGMESVPGFLSEVFETQQG